MTSIRKLLGLFMAFALAAFALPAVADSGDQFRMDIPATASAGDNVTFKMTITNKAGFDKLKSFTVPIPGGVVVTGVSGSSSIPLSKIDTTTVPGKIIVTGISIGNNLTGSFTMTANFPAAACTDTPYSWSPTTAKGGFLVSNEVFTLDTLHSNTTTTVAKGCYTVTATSTGNGSIGATPQSILPGGTAQFTLVPNTNYSAGTVTSTCGGTLSGLTFTTGAVNANNCTVQASFVQNNLTISGPTSAGVGNPYHVNVTLTGPDALVDLDHTGCPAFTSLPALPASSSNKSVSFDLTFSVAGSCTLYAKAMSYNNSPNLAFTVFPNTSVGCGAAYNTSQGQNAPGLDPNGLAFVGDAGEWGLRQGQVSGTNNCPPLNFALNVDKENNASNLVYDKAALDPDNPATFKYVVIWKSVPVNPSGWETFRPNVSWGITDPVVGTPDYVPALMCLDDPENFETLDADALKLLFPTIPDDSPLGPYYTASQPPYNHSKYAPHVVAQMCVLQQGYTLMGSGMIQYWDKVLDRDGHMGGP